MQDTPKWYVVHTYSGYENKVAQNIEKVVENRKLQDLVHEVKIPTETVVEIKEDKTREVERKLFPSYVFVKMILTDDTWYVVRNIRGVTGFVGTATKPVPLTEKEIASLGVETKSVEVNYKAGDQIDIVSGQLDGFSGTVESVDVDNNKVSVTISMFGRETLVELELDQVKLAK